ncbi:MarR family winged helix-turn-helix transcriptional regulator [Paenibacillus sp. MMS18-CY102]|uniref:MarR family winged helix-turn-helix transcriptional regulator n=1 Tax=Paenibacillus sp. MMS18-CY102 TaxID=2682849 RepID=UPI001365E574|nr:MarR family transcriptional regulator [Paenibacillus sp. MMS18-CY102]MWC27145.1 MarR family transcriptional regulator [Paenibacillus sp. MMS18-CY102]
MVSHSFQFSQATMHLLIHVYRLHRQHVDASVQPLGVSPGQPPVLARLTAQDGQVQKDLAARVNLQPATLNVMIGRMEKASLVKRLPDAANYRVSRVYLTDQGKAAAEAVNDALGEIEQISLAGFSAEEEQLFRQMLQRVHYNLSAHKSLHAEPSPTPPIQEGKE